MRVVDEVENEAEPITITETTSKVPGGISENSIVFSYSETESTSGPVIVTITNQAGDRYTLEYTEMEEPKEEDWKTVTGNQVQVTKTKNGIVIARLKDSTGQLGDIANTYITNIVCTVSYNINTTYGDADESSLPDDQIVIQGATSKLSDTIPTRAGYDFRGWGIDSSSTEVTKVEKCQKMRRKIQKENQKILKRQQKYDIFFMQFNLISLEL